MKKHTMDISIAEPHHGGEVPYASTVCGTVCPPNTPVQVLVYSNDGQFYVQKDAKVHGRHWSVDTKYGFPDSAPGLPYTVVAVAGPKLTESPIPDVPVEHVMSEAVKVTKKHW